MNYSDKKRDFRYSFGPGKDILDREQFIAKYKGKVDFIIFDEGSINDSINLFWRFGLSKNSLVKNLYSINYIKESLIVSVETDSNISLQRIINRAGDSFIDVIKDESIQKNILIDVSKYFSYVSEYLKDLEYEFKSVSSIDIVDKKVKTILFHLRQNKPN